jgi:hypothetical protein
MSPNPSTIFFNHTSIVYQLGGAVQIPTFNAWVSWRFSKVDIDERIRKQSLEGLDASKPALPVKAHSKGDK